MVIKYGNQTFSIEMAFWTIKPSILTFFTKTVITVLWWRVILFPAHLHRPLANCKVIKGGFRSLVRNNNVEINVSPRHGHQNRYK